MSRKTTSSKRRFSLGATPITRIKAGTKVKLVSSSERLRDQELIFKALWQCLVEQDIDSFKDVLRGHLEASNKDALSKKARTSRRTLHRMLSAEGNPTLKSISKVISAMYSE
jgi:DNA-binding phage protein